MKKKLESELISIAHRILKLKNKSELVQLHAETRTLYEKLSVLKFYEENFEALKPTIGRSEIEDKLDSLTAEEPVEVAEEQVKPEEVKPEVVKIEEVQPEVIKPEPEADPEPEKQDVPANIPQTEEQPEEKPDEKEPAKSEPAKDSEEVFKPAFEWSFDKSNDEPAKEEQPVEDKREDVKPSNGQIAFEDLLGANYVDPVFVKPEELESERRNVAIKIDLNQAKAPERLHTNDEIAQKTVSLNDRLSKGITVGLNDRIAFVKHLFNNSSEDYNRVLSQLITFDTFAEAQEFIDQMVKPDYNNWQGKDEYAQRFMEVVEKKFA